MKENTIEPIFAASDVEIASKSTLYQGFYTLNKYGFYHALYEGGKSALIEREIIERCHAVGVIPYDPIKKTFVMIEQIRFGALASSESPWLLECVAGMIEPGEEKEDVCVREAEEEAGLKITTLTPMMDYLVSPGASTERIYLYLAAVDSTQAEGVFGLPDEGEDILVKVIPEDIMLQMVNDNRIDNAACLIALQHFFLNKERYLSALNVK